MASLARGDYRLVGAIEGSRAGQWYRQLIQTANPRAADGRYNLACDCPAWCSNHAKDRTCKHTELTSRLLVGTQLEHLRPIDDATLTITTVVAMQPLLQGLHGDWAITEAIAPIGTQNYRVSVLDLTLDSGHAEESRAASAFVALNRAHRPSTQGVSAAAASWAGWAIAAEVARLRGFGDLGAPPSHHYQFKSSRSTGRSRRQQDAGAVGVFDLLTIGQREDLGDGLRPSERAEACLRMFLGPRYAQLCSNGFLDVSSRRFPQRVYRVRIDPARRVDRRVRVFEHGRYTQDLCIVRQDRQQPAADCWLTVFLGFMSDEQHVLRVVGQHNIFRPHSDGAEQEHLPAVWQAPHMA